MKQYVEVTRGEPGRAKLAAKLVAAAYRAVAVEAFMNNVGQGEDSTWPSPWLQDKGLCYDSTTMISHWGTFALLIALLVPGLAMSSDASAQDQEDSGATTELSCSFTMEKGDTGHPCHVPFPQGCLVASIPGTKHPWTTISKGGRLQCRFDETKTDWKTNIVGTCDRCQSVRCSAHFSVRFDCSAHH
ncbi:MAG: hypothetical protein HOO98_17260 [Nitrospira sp.]|nr:hypothetical protein [Nitrospira sp.]